MAKKELLVWNMELMRRGEKELGVAQNIVLGR